MHETSTRMLLTAAATAIALTVAVPAAAQTQQQPAQVTEEDLQSYAAAVVEVQRISEKWLPRIEAAPSDDHKAVLQQQAQDKMIEAVRDEGMTVEEYNEISRMAQADPQLWQQVQGYMKQAQ